MDPRAARRQEMCNLISAICLILPSERSSLSLSRRCVHGWCVNVPTHSSLPLIRDMMLAFAFSLFSQGRTASGVVLAVSWVLI